MSHRHNEMHMEIFVNGYFCGGGREWLGRSVREKNFGGGVGGNSKFPDMTHSLSDEVSLVYCEILTLLIVHRHI